LSKPNPKTEGYSPSPQANCRLCCLRFSPLNKGGGGSAEVGPSIVKVAFCFFLIFPLPKKYDFHFGSPKNA
jgi:hypothetical protein